MKRYLYLILIFPLSFNAYAEESTSIRLNYDSAGAHRAKGVAVLFDLWNPESHSLMVSLGLSANKVESDVALADLGRNTIHPVYGFAALSLNHSVSPFFEIGVDLGDSFIDSIFNGDGSTVDAYYSLGLTLSMNKKIGVSFYRKRYDIEFYQINNPATKQVDLDVTGVSISYYIK